MAEIDEKFRQNGGRNEEFNIDPYTHARRTQRLGYYLCIRWKARDFIIETPAVLEQASIINKWQNSTELRKTLRRRSLNKMSPLLLDTREELKYGA